MLAETDPEPIHYASLEDVDWTEIYYALEQQAKRIEQGEYDDHSDPDNDKHIDDWVAHLRRIMEVIGEEGMHMTPQRPRSSGERPVRQLDRKPRS